MRTLFDPKPLARRDDPVTSKASAAKAESVQSKHEALILKALQRIGRGTKDDIAQAAHPLDAVSVARRMRKLANEGRVVEDGVEKLGSGRNGTAWRVA